MSKFKSKLARRIMAIVLSGAMVMSNMSVYAAELSTEATTEVAEEVTTEVESEAEKAEEADVSDENNDAEAESSEIKASTVEASTVEETTEEAKTDEASTEDETQKETSTETETTEVETTTEEETTEVETTEVETTEEETEEESSKVEKDNKAGVTYTLDPADIEPFASGKNDGDTDTVNDYFTIIYDSKSKVEANKKSFEDGWDSVNRINFNGGVSTKKNAIKFKTSASAIVKVWWGEGGSDNREMAILDDSGKEIAKTTEGAGLASNALTISTLEIPTAGTYYLGGTPKKNYIYKVEVTEASNDDNDNNEPKVYELKADDVTTGVVSTKAGTEDYFTVTAKSGNDKNGNPNTISLGTVTGVTSFVIDDETTYEGKGISFGGSPTAIDANKNAYATVGFKVPSGYTAEILVAAAAKAKAAVGLYGITDDTPTIVGNYTYQYEKETPAVTTFENVGPGTYYVGNTKSDGSGNAIGGGNSLIYYVRVTLTKVKPVAWKDVPNPVIKSATQTEGKDEIVVTLSDAVINSDTGSASIVVTMYKDAACTEESKVAEAKAAGGTFNATDGSATATLAPGASGTYYFKAVGSRTNENGKKESNVYGPVEFTLPLVTPVIASGENIGGGTIKLSWGDVDEATGYHIVAYTDKACATEPVISQTTTVEYEEDGKTPKADASTIQLKDGLTVGKMYYFKVAAVRGEEYSEYSDSKRVRVTESADTTKYYVVDDEIRANGFVTGKIYGDPELITFEVLEKMPSTAISDGKMVGGVKYYATFQGSGNPDPNKGNIPTSGAVFKMYPADTVKVTFVTSSAAKTYHFIKVDPKTQEVLEDKSDVAVPEGSLSFVAEKDYIYYFYLDGSKVKFYDIEYRKYVAIEKIAWDEVPAPEIKDVKLSSDKKSIDVTVDAIVGSDGGDLLTVEMYDEEGKTQGTGVSATEQDLHTISIAPSSSGSYTFKASLTREAETEDVEYDAKESAETDAFAFVLPLSAPAVSSVTNLGVQADGKGKVEIDWVAAKEANGYIIRAYTDEACKTQFKEEKVNSEFAADGTVAKEVDTVLELDGFTIGETYYFKVWSTRGADAKDVSADGSTAFPKEITAEKQQKWSFAAYGSSTSITATTTNKEGKSVPKNGFEGDYYDGEVTVWSMGGAGKVVPATVDGLAFYYTAIDPKTTNFTLKATAHVNEWVLSNGQDGFGLMAADQVGENGNGDYLWTNSYQAVVSKIEYNWDGEKVTSDTTKPKIAMKIGVGATEKIGATKEDVELLANGDISVPANWSTSQVPLDTTYAKYAKSGVTTTCNMVGNAGAWDSKEKKWVENPAPSEATETYVDFELTLQKNNTGYFLSYKMPDGTVMTQKYYDTEALNHIDDNVYVGFFAARNANVTFKDIEFTTISPEDDAAPEPRPTTYIALTKSIASPSVTNTSDYDLVFTSNWDGSLVVKNSDNKLVGFASVTGSLDTEKAAYKDGDDEKNTKATVSISGLEVGKNVFTLTFTPHKMKNPPAYTDLESYDAVTLTLEVEYRRYGTENSIIYVSPSGKSTGTGTKEEPLDVFTAVKYAQPGQVIYLEGGRYSLYKTIKIEAGINGEEGNYITMMADPEAKERPVFDFNGKVTGMTMAGSWWYFKGFDVTGSLDGQKGIQVSGSHNVLDQINAYKNGNTGIQISRNSGSDTYKDWPSYNLILNCTSYLNADHGYEDADGFAAKLTIGSGNVFDGCIAAYNADDGWDLFAKLESGQIGAVTIQNCVAYKNGYVLRADGGKGELDINGTQVNAGNGNGFKMGGDGLPGGSIYDDDYKTDADGNPVYSGHKLKNSVAFLNKSKGFDSNSCSNNKIENSISFNNEGSNVALYTYSNVKNTGYETKNVISYRTKGKSTADEISGKGVQETDNSAYVNDTTYLWDTKAKAPVNKSGAKVTADWFVSTVFNVTDNYYLDENGEHYGSGVLIGRNADGTVNLNGFLELSETGKTSLGSSGLGGQASKDEDLIKDKVITDGTVSAGDGTITDDTTSDELNKEQDEMSTKGYYGIYINQVEEAYYTGTAVQPEIRAYLNGSLFTEYKVSYKNNVNAYVAGDERYKDIDNTKRPTIVLTLKGSYQGTYEYYFDIKPVDITDSSLVSISGLSGISQPSKFAPTLIYNGKKLTAGKDYTASLESTGAYKINATEAVSGNFTGVKEGTYRVNANATDISKASFKLATTTCNYTGEEVKPALKELPSGVTADDIEILYSNNINVGKGTVTILAKDKEGSNFVGSKTLPFTIKKTALKDGSKANSTDGGIVTVTGIEDKTYTGAALSPAKISVTVDGVAVKGVKKGSKDVNDKSNGLYKYGYTYQYKTNTEAGTATLTISGIHNFTGNVSYKFKILPATGVTVDVQDNSVKYTNRGLEVRYEKEPAYTINGTVPTIGIKYNGNTVSKKNYSISYKNNTKDAGETASFTITFKGSLKGVAKVQDISYKIGKCKFNDSSIALKSVSDVFTNGKDELKLSELEKSKVVLTNGNKVLTKKRDYYLIYEYDNYTKTTDDNGNVKIELKESGARYNSNDTAAGKNTIVIPENGLDITVYAYPAEGSSNYVISEDDKASGVKIAEFRAAYYDIAKAKFQLIDKAAYISERRIVNTKVYFVDDTEYGKANLGALNRLNYHKNTKNNSGNTTAPYYLYVTHSACDNELVFANYSAKGTSSQADYTYDYDNTSQTAAGSKSVTIYGTGKFGGTKVFKYTLIKKAYNLKSAVVDTKRTVANITDANEAAVMDAIKNAFDGKITVNGLELDPAYINVSFDKDAFNKINGAGSLKVTLTGAKVAFDKNGTPYTDNDNTSNTAIQVYTGEKIVSITVQKFGVTEIAEEKETETTTETTAE